MDLHAVDDPDVEGPAGGRAFLLANRGIGTRFALRERPSDGGLPPGFEVEEEDLRALVERKAVDRYAISARRITLYFGGVKEGIVTPFAYRLRPKFVIEAKTPPSTAYEYYAPDRRGEQEPQAIPVTD